jgi:hypothetical protein
MKMTGIKKIIERFDLDQFIQVSGMRLEVLREGIAGEEPDFICLCEGRKLGIEVRSLKKEQISKIAGIQRQIVAKAQKLAACHEMKPIEVKVSFGQVMPSMEGDAKDHAAEYLYRTCQNNIGIIQRGNGHAVTIDTSGNTCGIIHVFANWGEVNGKTWLNKHRWSTNEPHWVISKFYEELQHAIDRKNDKYDLYTRAIRECWLLLVVDRSKKDEPFDYSQMDRFTTYDSKFDRLFFLDLMERRHYELSRSNAATKN